MNWYKVAKHQNNQSMICQHCGTPLFASDITRNDKHIYEIGQMYTCLCDKSKIWTNSIRNEQNLIKTVEANQPDMYYQGFCNDLLCGFCGGNMTALDSQWWKGQSLMRFGCSNCQDNQHILMKGVQYEWPESVTQYLLPWYSDRIDQVKALASNPA